jgi:hypothetical protein
LLEQFGIPANCVQVKRFFPEDFLIFFSYYDDMPPPTQAHLQEMASMASAQALFFQIKVALKGIPSHARNPTTVQQALAPACTNPKLAETMDRDHRRIVVDAWCIQPDLVPCEKIVSHPRARGNLAV